MSSHSEYCRKTTPVPTFPWRLSRVRPSPTGRRRSIAKGDGHYHEECVPNLLFARKFIHLTLDSGLIEACRMLIENRIHRLPVIDPETGDLFAILNQKPLLKFLFNIPKVRTLTGLGESIEEAGVGSYDNISVSLSILVGCLIVCFKSHSHFVFRRPTKTPK